MEGKKLKAIIQHIYSSTKTNCDFCGLPIQSHSFDINAYYNQRKCNPFAALFEDRGLECCQQCATIILGEDTRLYTDRHDEYMRRWDDFRNIPWQQTKNPLVVMKCYKQWHIGVMRDKYGRRQYGVLLGAAERWNRREKASQYEDPRNTAIRDREVAESIAFLWVDFVDYFNVKPEESYPISAFNALSIALSCGRSPKKLEDIGYLCLKNR